MEKELNNELLELGFLKNEVANKQMKVNNLAFSICLELGHIDPLIKFEEFKEDEDYKSWEAKKYRVCDRCENKIFFDSPNLD